MSSGNPEPVIIKSPKGRPLKAAFIGCGGTGCNILAEGLLPEGHKSIAMGTDRQTMVSLKAEKKMLASARELESDAMIPSKSARLAGSEFERELAQELAGCDITFILAGLGGLSGGWGAVVGARAAAVSRSLGFCIASVPFSVEGDSRKERATAQLRALARAADGTVVIQNDMILAEAPNLPINRAFIVMNSVLASPVNLFLRSFGRDDLDMLGKHLALGKVMAMDSAEWDRENAEFSVTETLGKSKWLDLGSGKPKSAILFVEGRSLYGDLEELGKLFSRLAGKDCGIIVAGAGERKQGLRVTAVVGF
jgi:hypothetical protein